jgi:uncharacterized membrane protein
MNQAMAFLLKALVRGLIIVVPLYLTILLLLKAVTSAATLVRPLAALLPYWVPLEKLLAVLLVVVICVAVGAIFGTRIGQVLGDWLEKNVFERMPGYALFRSLTQQVTGQSRDSIWKAALFRSDEGLVPAFIIEEFEDGRYTVFVPSIPTPFSGSVYVLDRHRVHPLDVPFTDAIKVVSRWGLGAKDLVAAMETGGKTLGRTQPLPANVSYRTDGPDPHT